MTGPANPRRAAARDLLAVSSLFALATAFYWRIALAGQVMAGGDILSYFYPYWSHATAALRAGRLPLWNPFLFMGAPFLANSQVGFFYPLNWVLWLLFPAHASVHLTVVLHVCLAALTSYAWARRSLRLGRVGAWAAGACYGLGGYLAGQSEHVNQLQGLAWFPLMLLLWDWVLRLANAGGRHRLRLALLALAGTIAMVFLAGHTQTAFITLFGLAINGLGPVLARSVRTRQLKPLLFCAGLLGIPILLAATVAAVQLIPTFELARLSVRAAGLPFDLRVSKSLLPHYLTRALLPGFFEGVGPDHTEHVAYVGIAGLALAGVALHSWRRWEMGVRRAAFLGGMGLFLALGKANPVYLALAGFVPGFAHFRVPARWLALFALGAAALVGWGVESLLRGSARLGRRAVLVASLLLAGMAAWAVWGLRLGEGATVGAATIVAWAAAIAVAAGLLLAAQRARRAAGWALLLMMVTELFLAGSQLPHARATASRAFTSLRPAVAHVLADQATPLARFISMSDIRFDPGDLAEIELIYGPQLPETAVYDYAVAAKQKEVLSPNLPLAFQAPAVDGYDGGVLPLDSFVELQRLFLPEEQVSIDGRLRENMATLPDGRWLSLFNVRHVITDKQGDAWLDSVFYDLQFGASLQAGEEAGVAYVVPFEGTALGLVTHLEGAAALLDGSPAGVVQVQLADGRSVDFELFVGEHTAEGVYGAAVAHGEATVGGHFYTLDAEGGGQLQGNEYVTRLRWAPAREVESVVVAARVAEGQLVVRGVSLIDERTGSFQPLVLSDRGRFRLVHSGDVKIYENLDSLPRAFFAGRAIPVDDGEAALAAMQSLGFDPSTTVVLETDSPLVSATGGTSGSTAAYSTVEIVNYQPERVEISVESAAPGYLVLSDAWYPGWEATIDGEPVEVIKADLLFRAVELEAGSHEVTFSYLPRTLSLGAWMSALGLVAGAVIGLAPALWNGRRDAIMNEYASGGKEGQG
jgi:hypothetical protein